MSGKSSEQSDVFNLARQRSGLGDENLTLQAHGAVVVPMHTAQFYRWHT